MKVTSLHSKKDLIQYLKKQAPQLACDYLVTIEQKDSDLKDSNLIVTDLKMPQVGISYGNKQYLGHAYPTDITFSSFSMSYVRGVNEDPILDILNSQMVETGVPKFIPLSKLPTIYLYRIAPASSAEWGAAVGTSVAEVLMSESRWDLYEYINKIKVATADIGLERVGEFHGCRFGVPVPNIDLSTDRVVTYSVAVTFESFILY